MSGSEALDHLRHRVAIACRVLADQGLVSGTLGHVSSRTGSDELLVRCRGRGERGLRWSDASDVWRFSLDGTPLDVPAGYEPPNELPIHTELMRRRPDVGAVVHAHPRAAVLCSLAGLVPRPVIGAYNIPAMRMAQEGVPVYPRAVLVTRPELAAELERAMSGSSVCLMLGHGITVAARTVEQAVVQAVNLHVLLELTVELAQLRAEPALVSAEDLEELPDLGPGFNDGFAWRSLVADLGEELDVADVFAGDDGSRIDSAG